MRLLYVHDCPGELCTGHIVFYNAEELGGFVYERPKLYCQLSHNELKLVSINDVKV